MVSPTTRSQCTLSRLPMLFRTLVELGPSAPMADFNAQAAYRNVQIHPSDRHLLGMRLRGN